MPVVVVANPKGGVGKSTLSTNIAGYFASQGHPVILGDTDRQQSARLWLGLRPPAARPIGSWDTSSDVISRPPKGTTHAEILEGGATVKNRAPGEIHQVVEGVAHHRGAGDQVSLVDQRGELNSGKPHHRGGAL